MKKLTCHCGAVEAEVNVPDKFEKIKANGRRHQNLCFCWYCCLLTMDRRRSSIGWLRDAKSCTNGGDIGNDLELFLIFNKIAYRLGFITLFLR
jgi:hypothetical protein